MIDEIRTLLDGPPAPSSACLEERSTTGYAHALGLEGDRLRVERRLRSLVRPTGGPTSGEIAELRGASPTPIASSRDSARCSPRCALKLSRR